MPPRLPNAAERRTLSQSTIQNLTKVVSDAVKTGASTAASAATVQRGADELIAPRHAQAVAFSDVAELTRLPPVQANLTYARLLRGSAQIMETPVAQKLGVEDAHILHSLLLTGEHHNRWVHHNGRNADEIPSLHYMLGGPAGGSKPEDSRWQKTLWMQASPQLFRSSAGVIGHESVHELQLSGSTPIDASEYKSRPAPVDTATHPRAEMHELNRGLPSVYLWSRVTSDLSGHLYRATPVEAAAMLETASIQELLPRDKRALQMPPFPPDSGMDKLVTLLIQAGRDLNPAQEHSKPMERLTQEVAGKKKPEPPIAKYEPTGQRPDISECMEHILFCASELADAMKSGAWEAKDSQELDRRMNSLVARIGGDVPFRGLDLLQEIHGALSDFTDELKANKGPALHKSQGSASPQEVRKQFDQAKQAPVDVLQEVLQKINAEPRPGQTVYANVQGLGAELERAKLDSGFQHGVQQLLATPGRVPASEAVRDTVMRLAATLLGIEDVADLPPALLPSVLIYEAASTEFELAPGLNAPPPHGGQDGGSNSESAGSHQKRKATFDLITWRLRVPEHLFHPSESHKLQDRLAGLAADIAYTTAAAMAHGDETGRLQDKGRAAAGLWGSDLPLAAVQVLRELGQDPLLSLNEIKTWKKTDRPLESDRYDSAAAALRETEVESKKSVPAAAGPSSTSAPTLRQRSEQYIAAHPDSAAAALRAVVDATPVKDLAPLWHLGPRAEVKAAAKGGGSDDARDAYEARTVARSVLPAVAFRRALIGPRAAPPDSAGDY